MRLSRLVLRIAISLALAIAILCATATLWIDGPDSPALAGALAGARSVGNLENLSETIREGLPPRPTGGSLAFGAPEP